MIHEPSQPHLSVLLRTLFMQPCWNRVLRTGTDTPRTDNHPLNLSDHPMHECTTPKPTSHVDRFGEKKSLLIPPVDERTKHGTDKRCCFCFFVVSILIRPYLRITDIDQCPSILLCTSKSSTGVASSALDSCLSQASPGSSKFQLAHRSTPTACACACTCNQHHPPPPPNPTPYTIHLTPYTPNT